MDGWMDGWMNKILFIQGGPFSPETGIQRGSCISKTTTRTIYMKINITLRI